MKLLSITAAILSAASCVLPAPANGARAAILISKDSVLYEKCADERLPMASTTKIMTCLLAVELCDPDEIVTVGAESAGKEGSSLYLKEGDTVTVRDLEYAAMLRSANDAASALACHISFSEEEFSVLMNEKASELGLGSTHFTNPHGLDGESHYTTARDLARLAMYSMNDPEFAKIASCREYVVTVNGTEKITVTNHNRLLFSYTGCDGVKTGYTIKSGRCLVTSAERDGIRLVCVTLNDRSDWRDHASLLDYGFEAVSRSEQR